MPELPYLHSVKGHLRERRGYVKRAVVLCIVMHCLNIVWVYTGLCVRDKILSPIQSTNNDPFFKLDYVQTKVAILQIFSSFLMDKNKQLLNG